MAAFGPDKEAWLKQFLFLSLPQGICSHDTFRRVFCLIKPTLFIDSLVGWTQAIGEQVAGEVGGHRRRELASHRQNQREHGPSGQCLGQIKVDAKSNKITAVPELLRMLELAGCIVTIDAMGRQKNIAKEISKAHADYVLCLKGKHGKVGTFLDDAIVHSEEQLDTWEKVEKAHGRIGTRRAWISEKLDWFADKPKWEKLRSVGVIEATGQIGDKTTTERRYFLCSLPAQAKAFAQAARFHWGIENSLHWVPDVSPAGRSKQDTNPKCRRKSRLTP